MSANYEQQRWSFSHQNNKNIAIIIMTTPRAFSFLPWTTSPRLPLLQSVGVHGGEPQGSDMWLMFLMLRPLLLHWSLLSTRCQMDVWDEWGGFRNLARRSIFSPPTLDKNRTNWVGRLASPLTSWWYLWPQVVILNHPHPPTPCNTYPVVPPAAQTCVL